VRNGGRQTSETFPNEAAAKVFCQEVAAWGVSRAIAEKNRRDTAQDDYIPTLREWYKTSMAAKTGITDGTRQDYDRLANRVMLPMLGDYHLDQIDRTLDAAFITRLSKTPKLNNRGNQLGPGSGYLSPKTISTHHGLLSKVTSPPTHAEAHDSPAPASRTGAANGSSPTPNGPPSTRRSPTGTRRSPCSSSAPACAGPKRPRYRCGTSTSSWASCLCSRRGSVRRRAAPVSSARRSR
jgi:hypothetical protein